MNPFYFIPQHGKIKQVRLVTNRAGKSRGYAYVEYEEEVSEAEFNERRNRTVYVVKMLPS